MSLADAEIQEKLDEVLHKPLAASDEGINVDRDLDVSVHDSPCFHFLCQQDPHYSNVKQLVKSLSWELKEHNVVSGALILITAGPDKQTLPFILGVAVKKPMFHMLIRAFLDRDRRVRLTESQQSRPRFQCSHEVMLEILQAHSPNPDAICSVDIEVWKCNAFIDRRFGQEPNLRTMPVALLHRCTICTRKQHSKKKPVVVKLPFGFGRKPRRKTKNGPNKGKAERKGVRKTVVKKAAKQQAKADANSGSTASSNDDDDDSDSSSSHDSEAAEASLLEAEKEEEQVQPMSSVVALELKQVPVLAEEVSAEDESRANARNEIETRGEAAVRSSFFSKQIGLWGASVAVTGRARCWQCKNPIWKNTVRYSFFHSVKKPEAWVHNHCIVELIRSTGVKQQACKVLRDIISKKNNQVFDPVIDDSEKVLRTLEALA